MLEKSGTGFKKETELTARTESFAAEFLNFLDNKEEGLHATEFKAMPNARRKQLSKYVICVLDFEHFFSFPVLGWNVGVKSKEIENLRFLRKGRRSGRGGQSGSQI